MQNRTIYFGQLYGIAVSKYKQLVEAVVVYEPESVINVILYIYIIFSLAINL